MTIPQGENRGPQSVSERRKVNLAGSGPCAEENSPKTPTPQSSLSLEDLNAASGDTAHKEKDYPEFNEDLLIISDDERESDPKDFRNQRMHNKDHLEVNVTVVLPTDPKKGSLPLLNSIRGDGPRQSSSDRTKKLSLNLTKPFQKQLSEASTSERTRRFSQTQKSTYERVPQYDPSPISPQIFTLQDCGEVNPAFRYHASESKHGAEIHSSFNAITTEPDASCYIESSSRESSAPKKVFFCAQKSATQASSAPFKSFDDLSLSTHVRYSGIKKSACPSRSASSEDLQGSRKKPVSSGTSGGGNHNRQHQEGHCSSNSSPFHCCLVSVSRVPMAAATSHLTLDSDYQTVRLAVLGAPGVGKSSIVRQFVMQQFVETYVPTQQRQVFSPAVIINEHLYEVRIIDCPYIPYFPVNSLYEWTDFRGYGLRNATAYVLVYDITSEESFEYIKTLRLQILESRNRHDVPIFVVGNKHDLAEEKGVPRREVREIANLVKKQWKCGYIECSAKYNWHIMLLFKELMKTVDYIDYGHKPTSVRVQDALRRNRCLIL